MEKWAIVIPCLNEAENLDELIPRLRAVLENIPAESELWVLDGGSQDGSPEVAAQHGARVLRQRGAGYGGAIRTAFEDIQAPYIATLDADFSHPPEFLQSLYTRREEADIVIASRYIGGGRADMPWLRHILSLVLNGVYRRVLSLPVRDLSSGFRLYRRETVSPLQLQSDTYAILPEIVVKTLCTGGRLLEIPFQYQPRRHGRSHIKLLRFGKDYLCILARLCQLRYRPKNANH
jgi:dolichol-phosphate mannosyltransferase